jgi:hypothetical protein
MVADFDGCTTNLDAENSVVSIMGHVLNMSLVVARALGLPCVGVGYDVY